MLWFKQILLKVVDERYSSLQSHTDSLSMFIQLERATRTIDSLSISENKVEEVFQQRREQWINAITNPSV